MKKVFLTLMCAVCALTVSAQRASSSSFFSTEKVDNPLTIGVRAGGNLSNFTGDGTDDLKSRFGFNVGVSLDYSIMESFGIQTGLYLTTKGAKADIEDAGYDEYYYTLSGTKKWNPMYLQIPVLASYRYYINDNLRWEFNAGPYFAFGVGGKIKEEGTVTATDGRYSASVPYAEEEVDFFNDGTNSFDTGIVLGTGLTYSKFYFGIQYEIGMTNIYDSSNSSVKNSNFTFNIGYNF